MPKSPLHPISTPIPELQGIATIAAPAPDAGDMAAFGASHSACYLYPGEAQQPERAAFCAGAAYIAVHPSDEPARIPREPTEAMMDAGLYHASHDATYADVHSIWKGMFDAVTLDGGCTVDAPSDVGSAPDASVREKVARIIDPEAFQQEVGAIRRARAERKADAILALTHPQTINAGEDARIDRLRRILHRYGDRVPMAMCHRPDWQQEIDEALGWVADNLETPRSDVGDE
jgi:hypothetical protein